MKAVLLAGGFGTRISEESQFKPKPMVEIGGRPILWHIMKIFSHYNVNDFIICCGYKQYVIKEYFANYCLHNSDVTFDMRENMAQFHQNNSEPWKVTLVDTGEASMTGGRLRRVQKYLDDDDFCFTYGDGLADIDVGHLILSHKESGKLATVTAVRPPGRFGVLDLDGRDVSAFEEKPHGDGSYINGGFFVLDPKVIDLISGDDVVWERGPMEKLTADRQLNAFRHTGFWQPMDTLRDKLQLEKMWADGKAPWRTW